MRKAFANRLPEMVSVVSADRMLNLALLFPWRTACGRQRLALIAHVVRPDLGASRVSETSWRATTPGPSPWAERKTGLAFGGTNRPDYLDRWLSAGL